jgi:predicted acetyltransferase
MIIRKPNPNESEQIISLLQASLGESLLKKTATIWDFKHVKNPFGASYILVAEEDQKLIGVRALMQWNWQIHNEVWSAYRAVDTATHPDFQGKGIFTKLTLKALKDVQEKGEAFVFNTPNDKSRPGYLKMGWQEVGKIKVALIPLFFYFFKGLFSSKRYKNDISAQELESLCDDHNAVLQKKNILFTPKSASYLKWRYEENPMQNYKVVSGSNWYLAMYVKKHKFFNELRVAESLGELHKENKQQMQRAIMSYARKRKCLLITVADKNLFAFSVFGAYGPMLTFKSLTSSNSFVQNALDIENWHYSLGDLELF